MVLRNENSGRGIFQQGLWRRVWKDRFGLVLKGAERVVLSMLFHYCRLRMYGRDLDGCQAEEEGCSRK